ncbi:MAG: ribosome-associated translation inhibitor RaiA [Planctomycetota bacterium]|jgi:putative sigma-54 modulation protein|nr:ribosome-associated translation inhibitor RaiA [Planctomycetota bacterium]
MLDIQITGVHYDVSPRLREYVETKLGALERFSTGLKHLHVTIREAGNHHGYRVDVEMHLPGHKDVVAHDSEETVYAAVDVVSDKVATQLRKIHDKQSHPKRSDRMQVRA